MQKHKISALLVIAMGLSTSGLALAQDDQGAPAPPPGRMQNRMPMDPDHQVQMLTRQLNLSTDQQNQLRPIFEDQMKRMMSLRQDTSLSREDRMAKMRTMREDSDAQIKAVLTDDQRTKYDQFVQQRRERMMERRQQQQQQQQQPPADGTGNQ